MPLQNFIANSLPTIKAAWLNQVDTLKFTIFGDSTTKAQARAALTSDAPFGIDQGGTGINTGVALAFSGTDSGAANAAVVTVAPAGFARTTGVKVSFSAAAVNTTAATLNVNGTGVAAIVNQLGNACTGGELFLPVTVQWNGTAWRIIAGGLSPELAKQPTEITAAVTIVNYLFKVGCVDRYVANTTPGTTNCVTGFNAAFAVAALRGCEVTWGATAPYRLNSAINCTAMRGVVVRDLTSGNASASAGASIIIAHTEHGFDCTGSSEFSVYDMHAKSLSGVVPKSLFLLARNSGGSGAGLHRFYNLGTTSDSTFTQLFYSYGSEENVWQSCCLQNAQPGSTIININGSNPSGYTSTFATIAVGNQSNVVFTLRDCELFNFGNSGSANETCIQLERAGNFIWDGGLAFCVNGRAYLNIVGGLAVNGFTWTNIRGEVGGTVQDGLAANTTGTTGVNAYLGWYVNNSSFQCSNVGINFGDTAEIQRLEIGPSVSATSGALFSAKFIENARISNTSQTCTFRAAGTATGVNFFGSRAALTFSGTETRCGGFDAATGNYWETGDAYTAPSTACTGAITTAVVYKIGKRGKLITLRLPSINSAGATATTNFVFGSAIPVQYRPSATIRFTCQIRDNGASLNQTGIVQITTAGVINVFKDGSATANFTAAAGAGLPDEVCFSWIQD